jgi:hypothetical protein
MTSADLHLVVDVVIGTLVAGGLRLILLKAFLEPAAAFLGRRAYRRVDEALGDRLPDWIK